MEDISFRPANAEEADELAAIIQATSGGLVDYLLTGIVPFTKPIQILKSQVISKDSIYSYRNTIVCEENGEIIGMVLAYPSEEQVISDMTKRYLPKKRFEVVKELLGSAEPNSLYINTFWVHEKYRGEGLAAVLMDVAADWAKKQGRNCLSLHVWKENLRGVGFYTKVGFQPTKEVDFPDHDLLEYSGGKLQMRKDVE